VAFGGAGGISGAVTGAGIAVSPSAPSALTAAAVSASQINLAWQDTSGNETEFRIEQTTGPGTFGQIAAVGANTTSYPSTGVSPTTTYVYRVRACNAVGCSAYSNEATATTPGGASLTVTLRGSGRGTVTSTPAGIRCGPRCSASFAPGRRVALTARAESGARFNGWDGACDGRGPTCSVRMNGTRSVTATFSKVFHGRERDHETHAAGQIIPPPP
jgi:hypothetical protein